MTGNAPAQRRPATFAQTARAVPWSCFGVRSRAGHQQDERRRNPVRVIAPELAGAGPLVVGLGAFINFVVLR